MTTTILRTSRSLREYINEAINDTLHKNALDEEEKQEAQVSSSELFSDKGDTAKTAPSDAMKTPDATKEQPETKTGDELKTGDVSPEAVIDVLNSIRAGKSFNRDEIVKSNLTSYVNNLSKAEKTALLAFLKGISQIVTGVVDAQTATEPEDPDPSIKMKKGNITNDQQNVKHIKPTITKNSVSSSVKQTGVENTMAPKMMPIQPKNR
jgi:hypothetical protein